MLTDVRTRSFLSNLRLRTVEVINSTGINIYINVHSVLHVVTKY